MRRRTLLTSVGTAVGGAGCLTTLTNEETVHLQYLEIDHQVEKPETYHLILQAAEEMDYWTSVDVEPRSITTICDGGWSDDVSTFKLFVRLDEQSNWKSWEISDRSASVGISIHHSEWAEFELFKRSRPKICSGADSSDSSEGNASNSSFE